MQARHAGVIRRLLARLAHDDLDLGAALGDGLLDPARMDTSVGDELGECHARHFAADRVEAGEDHRLRRVVDDQVHAGGLLERPDVAALTADDATLHLLRGQADHRDGRFGGVIRGDALHDRGQDAARLFVAFLNRAALDLAHPMLRLGFRLIDDLLDHRLARLDHRQPAYPLERRQLLLPQVGDLAPFGLQLGYAFLGGGLATLQRLELTVETLGSVEQQAFLSLQVRAFLARFILRRSLLLEHRVLALEDDLLLLGACLGDDAFGVRLGVLDARGGQQAPGRVAQDSTNRGGNDRNDQDKDGFRQFGSLRQWSPHRALLRRYGASDFNHVPLAREDV